MVIAMLIAAAWFDCRYRRIPNWLTLGSVGVGLLLAVWRQEVLLPLAGMLIGGLLMWFPNMVRPGSIGIGDVKLIAALGALTGPTSAMAVIGLASFFATAYLAVIKIAAVRDGKVNCNAKIPLAPFALIGQLALISGVIATAKWY